MVIPLVCALFAASDAAYAQLQVPFPNVAKCNGDNIELAKKRGLLVAVPGKPSEKGFLAGGPIEDLQGNVINVWCLAKNDAHGGPDLGYLYTPKGKNGVWVGACTLTTGQNLFTIKTDKLLPGPDGGATFNKFTGFTWKNYANDDGKDTVKKDFEYDYDAVRDKLSISRTEGKYIDVKNANGKTARVLDFKVVETQKDGPIAAPDKFEDLKLNGTRIAATDADNQLAKAGLALARKPTEDKSRFAFTLSSHSLFGTGTDADPFTGIAIEIFSGDILSIGGTHIHDASVSGDALSSLFGAWVFDGLDDHSVTFRATMRALLEPGTLIDGFSFFADPTHSIAWFYLGADELASSAAIIVPEPASLALFGLGALLLMRARSWRHSPPAVLRRLTAPFRATS